METQKERFIVKFFYAKNEDELDYFIVFNNIKGYMTKVDIEGDIIFTVSI